MTQRKKSTRKRSASNPILNWLRRFLKFSWLRRTRPSIADSPATPAKPSSPSNPSAMPKIDSLEAAYKRSFEDKFFSKAERDELRQLYVAAQVDRQSRSVLRAKIFAMARAVAKDQDTNFAFEWLEAATRVIEERIESVKTAGSQVYFSPGDACLNAIVSQIAAARKTLDVCVFTISDDRISDAIVACHRSKVKVRIITDNEKLQDLGSDIERFAKAGIAVRVDRTEAHMHHKFALIDGKTALTGSYNWTRSAAIYNEENLLVTSEAYVIQSYAREFEKMWADMDAY